MKVYLLYRKADGEESEDTELVGVYYSSIGAKVDAERKDGKLDWVTNDADPKYITKFFVSRGDLYYAIQEWEVQ